MEKTMKTIRPLHIIVIVMTLLNLTSAAYAGKYALVIGNGTYKAVPPLDTPVNDANTMASTLKSLGFSVDKGTDLTQQEMETAVRNFRSRLSAGDTALFYYSGHGVEVDGTNYLIPIEISKDMIRYKAIPANLVIDKMEEAGSKVNIVILDACRSNLKGGKGFGKGLAQMIGGEGTFIAYATAPGTEAFTGSGSTSIYTRHLVNIMKKPGLKIEDVFKQVRKSVMDETSKEQKPWDSSSLTGDFYFSGEGGQRHETPPSKRKYWLRSKPLEVSEEDAAKVFNTRIEKLPSIFGGTDRYWKPTEYFQNDFRDNGDGTITDSATGLMWQKTDSPKGMDYQDAKAYVENLNREKFAGYNDWRLPTDDESKSLLTPTSEKQSDGAYIKPIFLGAYSFCWTSDQKPLTGFRYVWQVNFIRGGIEPHVSEHNATKVRAVRSIE